MAGLSGMTDRIHFIPHFPEGVGHQYPKPFGRIGTGANTSDY
jgi:hypothetical protein